MSSLSGPFKFDPKVEIIITFRRVPCLEPLDQI